jgi:hypothetical protein
MVARSRIHVNTAPDERSGADRIKTHLQGKSYAGTLPGFKSMGQSYRYGLQRNPKPVLGEVEEDTLLRTDQESVCVLLEACIL